MLLWRIIVVYNKEISELMTNPKISLSDGGFVLFNVGIKSHR